MTTFRDLLKDFQKETLNIRNDFQSNENNAQEYIDDQESLLDEYVEIIKERIVG